MLRSKSQILWGYLPGAVFRHEDRVYGRVVAVHGDKLSDLNEQVVYDAIASYLEQWSDEYRYDLPIPRDSVTRDYRIVRPEHVVWDLFPLVFECSNRMCGRVRSFRSANELAKEPQCGCGGRLQQLRFYNAHNCGQISAIYVPKCATHGYDDMFFENTGSFRTATWRCRGQGCNGGVVSRTNMSPCNCDAWPGNDGVVRMRAHTLDDSRAYRAHYVDLINIDSSVFQTYQRHPSRAQIAVAHYFGAISTIQQGMREIDTGRNGVRMSASEWAVKEQRYRAMGLDEAEIATLRASNGPVASGIGALGELAASIQDVVAVRRPFYERAAVFDTTEVPRVTLAQQAELAATTADLERAASLQSAVAYCDALGVHEIAVTWDFPVAKVAFGYTREKHGPNASAIRGFRHRKHHDGKYPVYALSSRTEALLVTLSARQVLSFLHARGEIDSAPADEEAARRELLEIFAYEETRPVPARTVRVLVHTLSHLLLRGLDDGQVGLAESSLAEWLVPETLTFAVYANTLKAFTLGSLWTLLNNRASSWLHSVVARSIHCENDPICYQQEMRACERCVYLTFGCGHFNHDLSREVVYEYLHHRGVFEATTSGTYPTS
ncbi:hypothetical protein HNP40_001415 [Mycobacteroides chelonae]|nr:hypothetical protein [Mycobacteroides chelonae]